MFQILQGEIVIELMWSSWFLSKSSVAITYITINVFPYKWVTCEEQPEVKNIHVINQNFRGYLIIVT